MKKLLVLALGVMLALSFAVPAMAETKVEFKGHYRVRYFQLDNFNVGKDGNAGYQNDHRGYFDQRFRIEPKFIVSDCLELRMRIHALYNNRWGQSPSAGIGGGAGGDYLNWDSNQNAESEFIVDRVFMVIKTGFGWFYVGRMEVGIAGLSVLGYSGGRFMSATGYTVGGIAPFDFSRSGDRIQWYNKWGNFSIVAGYQKDHERDVNNVGAQTNALNTVPPTAAASAGYDDDMDEFFVLPQFEWKTGSANFLINYIRGRSFNEQGAPGYDPTVWAAAPAGYTNPSGASNLVGYAADFDVWLLNPAVVLNFGPFAFHGEFAYAFGKARPDRDIYPNSTTHPNVNGNGWGVYMDGVYNYGPGEAGMMFHYVGGRNFNDNAVDDDVQGMLGIGNGNGHTPFLVAYDRGLFNRMELMNTGWFSATYPADYSTWNNHWMLGAYNDYNITEDFMMHAALGYFQLVNVPDNYVSARYGVLNTDDLKKDLGVEFDIGATYKIMDGLSITSVFGYFWTGSAWKYGVDAADLGNAYAWKNQLRLDF